MADLRSREAGGRSLGAIRSGLDDEFGADCCGRLQKRPHFDTAFDSNENEGSVGRVFIMGRQLLGDRE